MINFASPKRLNTWSRKSSAVPMELSPLVVGMSTIPFVDPWSRTTRMVSYPSSEVERSVSKSIESCENGRWSSDPGIACSSEVLAT